MNVLPLRMKHNLWALIVFCTILPLSGQSQAIDSIDVLNNKTYPYQYTGQSSDGRYIGYLRENISSEPSTSDIKRLDRETGRVDGVPGITFELLGDAAADLHEDGNRQIWLQRDTASEEVSLQLYFYNTGNQVRLIPETDLSEWIRPRYTHQFDEIYLIEDRTLVWNNILRLSRDVLFVNPDSIAVERVEPFIPDEAPFGSYLASDIVVSRDGRSVVFNMYDVYCADDCYYFGKNYLSHYNRDSGEHIVIKQLDEFPSVDLVAASADGNTVVYAEYFGSVINRFSVDTGELQSFDITSRITWLDVSPDGSTVVVELDPESDHRSNFFSDGRKESGRFTIEGLGTDAQLVQMDRQTSIVSLNLDTFKSNILNKLTSTQLLDARPVGFSHDGEQFLLYSDAPLQPSERFNRYLLTAHDLNRTYIADSSISGLWYDRTKQSQGFSIQTAPDSSDSRGQVVVFWYTFDADGSPLWLIVQGHLEGNSFSGEAYRYRSDGFGPDPATGNALGELFGTLTFEFSSCNDATVTYQTDVPGYSSGSLNLTRLSFQNGVGCL